MKLELEYGLIQNFKHSNIMKQTIHIPAHVIPDVRFFNISKPDSNSNSNLPGAPLGCRVMSPPPISDSMSKGMKVHHT